MLIPTSTKCCGKASVQSNSTLPYQNHMGHIQRFYTSFTRIRSLLGGTNCIMGAYAVSWAHHINYTSNGNVNGTIFTPKQQPTTNKISTSIQKHKQTMTTVTFSNKSSTSYTQCNDTLNGTSSQQKHQIEYHETINTSNQTMDPKQHHTINNHIATEHKQTTLQTQDIQNYFVRKSSQTKDTRKPP